MTEGRWMECEHPASMLEFLQGKVSDRKLRLFAAACCRRIERVFPSEERRARLDSLERWAEGLATVQEVENAVGNALVGWEPRSEIKTVVRECVADALLAFIDHHSNTNELAIATYVCTGQAADASKRRNRYGTEHKAQVSLLKDVIGNPFRPVVLDPSWLAWRDGAVWKMAQAIYDERRFGDLPILADALEDAGCHDADILGHCRQPGQHVRGCWVVDLLIGRS